MTDSQYRTHTRCGEPVRVLMKDGRITWYPSTCKHCGYAILTPEDLQEDV